MNVDTYVYARATKTFEGPVVHLGYYAIGALCHLFLKPFGITPLQTLGYMSQFFGGIAVGGMYLLTFLLTNNRLQGLLSALILMFSGAVWLFSIHGEVYVPQLAFVLLSLICLLNRRPLWSSIFILVAIAITPTSLLALVPAFYLIHMRHYGKNDLIAFTAPILTASAGIMLWHGKEVIGTFHAAIYSPRVFFDEFSSLKMAANIVYRLTYAYGAPFHVMSFLAAFGFLALRRSDKILWRFILSFILPFLLYFLNLGLLSPDHLIITFIAISFLGAFGTIWFFGRLMSQFTCRFLLIPVLLAVFSWISFEFFISRHKTYCAELERVIHELSNHAQNNAIMLADYNFGVSFWSLTHEEESEDLFAGRPHRFLREAGGNVRLAWDRLEGPFWVDVGGIKHFISIPELSSMMLRRTVYFVERNDWPVGTVEVLKKWLIRLGVEKQDKNPAKLNRIGEYLAHELGVSVVVSAMINSPLHPVYQMRFEKPAE